MSDRGSHGSHIVMRIGDATAGVALHKVSGDAPRARHETRKVAEDGSLEPVRGRSRGSSGGSDDYPESPLSTTMSGGETHHVAFSPPVIAQPAYRHGVTREDGTWADLTEELAAIDERCRLDAAEIVWTVPARTIPKMQVRQAHYVVPDDDGAHAFLAHVWLGLRKTDSAALLRWTKRTNQALGALVALHPLGDDGPALVLYELEWAAAMRRAPRRARLDVTVVPEDGARAAVTAMRALRKSPDVWGAIRDERNSQRIELLDAARAGTKWTPPPQEPPQAWPLGDAILAAR